MTHNLFHHIHPYEPFFPKGVTKIIVGTLPPPRFTTRDLNERDVDFCYGSSNGLLWPVLDQIFELDLKYETTRYAANQRKDFLTQKKIGVCDIVQSCKREKIDASDLGMKDIELRDIIGYLKKYPTIDTLIFTGGNSKNGPEYFFRKHLKEYDLKLELVSNDVPRVHNVQLEDRIVKTVSLTAPSGAANRAIGSMQKYKDLKSKNPKFNTLDFRVLQYKEFF
ncbi:uracil-DNA glycosylase family protein [Aquimarina sp. 2201CG5-10]|uniref:uracil-DNA glycosylase family protein n=1 Tax=Aquimarina callyspongiae TaxID=3098150 RepID=UPI002AB4A7EA|nr:uracil-DNA glycosylase family protein [Aquimarina sp. 2201CG5-10]MDY8134198.1 uracil-DNA glycosylase family protein [Aquimarina sp. 2201CG5-10]